MVYCTINTFILKHGFGGNFFTNEKLPFAKKCDIILFVAFIAST